MSLANIKIIPFNSHTSSSQLIYYAFCPNSVAWLRYIFRKTGDFSAGISYASGKGDEMSGATDTDHDLTATTGWETAFEVTKSVKASGI